MKRNIPIRKADDPKAYRKHLYELEKQESRRVYFSLSMEEYSRLEAAATRAKTKPGKMARLLTLAGVQKRLTKLVPADSILTLLLQSIRPIATNFNQLVRKGHRLGVNAGIMESANDHLASIRSLIEKAFDTETTMEQTISAYLWRDPEAHHQVQQILDAYRKEKGL